VRVWVFKTDFIMNAKEKKELAKIVYDFLDCKTGEVGHDSAVVANTASDLFNKIREKFEIQKEILEELEADPYLTDEDKKEFLEFLS
jgi:hypothetical protein